MENEGMLTTPEAANRLGISVPRVHQLIKTGRLPSRQFGRDHLIQESDLALVAVRKPGRPSKPKDEATTALASAITAEAITPKGKTKAAKQTKTKKAGTKKG